MDRTECFFYTLVLVANNFVFLGPVWQMKEGRENFESYQFSREKLGGGPHKVSFLANFLSILQRKRSGKNADVLMISA